MTAPPNIFTEQSILGIHIGPEIDKFKLRSESSHHYLQSLHLHFLLSPSSCSAAEYKNQFPLVRFLKTTCSVIFSMSSVEPPSSFPERFSSLPPPSPLLPHHEYLPSSPPKRALSPDYVADPPSAKRHQNVSRRATLHSYAFETRLGEHATYQLREAAARMAAQTKDKLLGLDPNLSTVTIAKEPSSSQTEIYEHQNQGQWELDVLRDYGFQSNIATALRAFLDSFYHFCGYKPKWNEWVKQTEPKTRLNPRFKPRGKCVESSRQMLEEFGIDENALAYLLGEGSCYHYNHDFVNELPVQVVAAAMSNVSRKCTASRNRAYSLVWFMLTGYKAYQTAVDLEDLRYMGTEGIKERRTVANDQTEQLPFHRDLFNME